MQIIQNIREKGTAIVIGVIALSLIGFILMDANLGSSRNGASGSTTLGKVNGVTVDNKEFAEKVKQIEAQYGGRVSGAQINMIRQNAWDQLIAEKLLTSEFDKMGLVFSPKELSAIMFSEDAPQSLKQAFSDRTTGEYDITKVQQWWQEAKKYKGDQRDAIEAQIIEPIKIQSLYTKYSSMIAAAGYYPTWMKEKESTENKTFATISYVAVPYNVISDSTVKVTDNDINDYVAKHKLLYTQEGGRQIAYVGFSINPTGADTLKTFQTVDALKGQFAADTNSKVFVSRNMSSRDFQDIYVPKSKLTGPAKDTLATLSTGSVYGPYLDGKEYVIAKLVSNKILPDSIKCRHILIATTDRQTRQPILSDSIAKQRIDSIQSAIQGGATFDEMEAKFSTDEVAHKDKGVMTFDVAAIQDKQSFAPEFGAFLLNENGESKKVVKTSFGWHYIEILEKKNPSPAYNLAYLAKEVTASDETVNSASAQANKLSGEAADAKGFSAYADKNHLQKFDIPTVVKENDYQLGNLQDARQLIKWAFDAKVGAVSEPFSIGDQFVVGTVTKVISEGLPEAAIARPLVETAVRNLKKATQIKTKLGATPTLEAAAAAYNVQQAAAGADSTITFGSQIINGIGQEPKVIGASFNKAYQTKVSDPIAGTNGVYVLKINSLGTKPAVSAQEEADQASARTKALAQEINSGWFESLKKLANIKDERSKNF